MNNEKIERLNKANQFIQVIAGCGRKFLQHNGSVAYLELSQTGKVFFIDHYTKKRIYTHRKYSRWNGFSSGGTMRGVIERLREYVIKGKTMDATYFQSVMGNGFDNPWGYGDDIAEVKEAALKLGIAN